MKLNTRMSLEIIISVQYVKVVVVVAMQVVAV